MSGLLDLCFVVHFFGTGWGRRDGLLLVSFEEFGC